MFPQASSSRVVSSAGHAHDEPDLVKAASELTVRNINELEARARQTWTGSGSSFASDMTLALRLAREEMEALQIIRSDRALASQLLRSGVHDHGIQGHPHHVWGETRPRVTNPATRGSVIYLVVEGAAQ